MVRLFVLGALWLQADPSAEGIKALEAKQYPAAVGAFERAVAADPADYSAHFHLGLAHSLNGDAERAIASYRKTLELKPGLYEAELNLGMVLLDRKQPAEAAKLLDAAAAAKPKEFRPVYYLAEALLASGRTADAEAKFRIAAELDAKSPDAQAGLGRALLRQGKLKDAEASLRQAGDANGMLELAALHEKAKDGAAAIAIYESLLQSGMKNPAVSERLGELLLEAGKPEAAIPHLEAAAKQSPTAANRFALATALLRTKQTEKSIQTMEGAIAADPNNAELRIAYAGLLRDQRNFSAAAQHFWKAAQLKPDSKDAWSGLATMLLSLENYTQALAAFDRLEALGSPNAGMYFLRALALDKTKTYQPAMEAYRKFLALSGGKHPDEEFKARQRIKVIEKELSRR